MLEGIIFVMMVVWLGIAGITAAHATSNGKTSLWGVVVALFGIFGLVGYAISLAAE